MQNLFLGMTLGNDPHTLGVYNAGKIAKMAGIQFRMLPPDYTNDEKLCIIHDEDPLYLGLSYRLSPDKAIQELSYFLKRLEETGLLRNERKMCFGALMPTLKEIHSIGLDKLYNISLMASDPNLEKKTIQTASFFGVPQGTKMDEIVEAIRRENEPEKIEILDQLAKSVISNDSFLFEKPLKKPSKKALEYLPQRIVESDIPVIRSHFGIPADDIWPTVEGIKRIANAGAIDEISIGSSDLSQRYYGKPEKFKVLKNDGGVPYKDISDLKLLAEAGRTGNFPSLKPYCHVRDIIGFIDDCLEVGMLKGAHQAIPLFWFNELDGRGEMSLEESIDIHLGAVSYLANKGIPVEMNDPNQWSSRFVHDTLFVVSYALIVSVMYASGVKDIILQCQFNKPATTGDYADLGKFFAVKRIVEDLRPRGNTASIYYEARSGIEHFSTDQKKAKFQLPRSVMLQMLIEPSILHLVSYCEADHIATANDVIESSAILRRAVRIYKENEEDIRKSLKWNVIDARSDFLYSEAITVLMETIQLGYKFKVTDTHEMYKYLSNPEVLKKAMQYRYMTAPGIVGKKYSNADIYTKVSEYGFLDCYENWEDESPMLEEKRIAKLKKKYEI